ncbi:hypothetical protein F5J12DRAFT_907539 [Pisolithus orientalis]|uniref:uncharacterized protein n=1 Tax=Pisolithus orientalis TaxID=936130 RepID=UPI002224E65D|nr:uncharacterized protein F5J12DRAFT_907539 [Pisolithus orientalis]KAI5990822.1 hypothetical protein F5J12DRAFT_907539 [Pisolithus orientalis]
MKVVTFMLLLMGIFTIVISTQQAVVPLSTSPHISFPRLKIGWAFPDEVINQCEASYEAADGNKQKAMMDCFNDTGIMALICHHDILLFLANIDTPGKQQKYSIALLEHLFSLLPSAATVVVLYNIGCILDCSLSKVSKPLFTSTHVLIFLCKVPNTFGHDSSNLSALIDKNLKYSLQHEWQIWLIDWHVAAIGLGMHRISEQGSEAQNIISDCGIGIPELQKQWSDQCNVPAWLKKELDTVLVLQADVEASDRALQAVHMIIMQGTVQDTLDALESLERSHNQLLNKIDVLYASLNIPDKFLELHGVNLEFVQMV